ncbi:MAG TPA: GGDEF domain-containing protein [Solirubrobacteraceae bacterium]|jgi:diguanylate cyclase (GGDEF)-like protein|nr:GGDEF domain-containing protein [Solirubrobacteraceae bacterium]
MVTNFPIERILDHLVVRIVDVLPVTAAGVTLISDDLEPRYVAASNGAALRFEQLQTELGEGPCLAAYRSGVPILVDDLGSEQRFPVFSTRALEAGLRAVFTFPLRHDDAQLGALDLYRDAPGPLSPESVSAAQTLADMATAYLVNAQARSDLQRSHDQSRDAALHDPLTGLANRVLMLERLEHAFRRCRRSGKTSAVFFVDLDEFKAVNDRYSHRIGDALLIAVAKRLTGVLRPGDSLARLSGDEFVVLCEDLDDPWQADAIAVRIGEEIAQPFSLPAAEINITASVGIAFTGLGNDAPEDLLDSADLAMYRTKRDKHGSHILDLRDLHATEPQGGLSRSLRGALERGEFFLEYQPIVDTVDGRLTGVEALMRWRHPSRGTVSPAVFIPFAEQSGQIIEMGQWALEQAWTDQHAWKRHCSPDVTVSVNVSAHQLMSAGFAYSVAALLDTAHVDPALLTLEMTESFLVRDHERALMVLAELKDLGVKLALDDFGTGYSSLSHLTGLPIHTVKIDPAFIANLGVDSSSHSIVNAIIDLAHDLGMTVVSEGVETAEQRDELLGLGCDACQGFYFARPAPVASLEALLEEQAVRGGGPTLLPLAQ